MMTRGVVVELAATVNREKWVALEGDQPEVGLVDYLYNEVARHADRLTELGARIYLDTPRRQVPDLAEPWPSVRVRIVVEVDEGGWRRHYGRAPQAGVPAYVAHVAWLSNVITRDNGTIELLAPAT